MHDAVTNLRWTHPHILPMVALDNRATSILICRVPEQLGTKRIEINSKGIQTPLPPMQAQNVNLHHKENRLKPANENREI